MKLIHKLLDYSKPWELPDAYIFTGNETFKNDGSIVMGRGAARQVRDSYPGIDLELGQAIKENPGIPIMPVRIQKGQWIIWFKVKEHWADKASLDLIRRSTEHLLEVATNIPQNTYHMNFPGIGNGRLDAQAVQPILDILPDNVRIYK